MRPVLIVSLAAMAAATSPAAAQTAPVVVSTTWLAENLRDEKLVVLHVGNEASYIAGHIPGARLMPLASFAPERNGLSTELPEPAALKDVLEAAGVSADSRIIVYSASHPPQLAARLYVTLDQFGLGRQTSMLDGGLRAWRAENRAVATEQTAAKRGAIDLRPRTDILVDHTYLGARLSEPATAIIDARDARFWTGEERNQQRAARAGRIPGAINVPFSSLVSETGRLLERDSLTAVFTRAGVAPGRAVVAYCHVGQQASLVFVAARLLGHDVRLYDGSFEDWSRRLELRVDSGPKR